MQTTRIEYSLEGTARAAAYEANFDLTPFIKARELVDPLGPVLLIEVRDPDDAAEIVAAIEKLGRTPKTRKRRKSNGAGEQTTPGSAAKPETPPSGNGGGTGQEASPKPLACGGTNCRDEGEKVVHQVGDPTCRRVQRRPQERAVGAEG